MTAEQINSTDGMESGLSGALAKLESAGRLAALGLRTAALEALSYQTVTGEKYTSIANRLQDAAGRIADDSIDLAAAISHVETLATSISATPGQLDELDPSAYIAPGHTGSNSEFTRAWKQLCDGKDPMRWFSPREGTFAGRLVMFESMTLLPRQAHAQAAHEAATQTLDPQEPFTRPIIINGAGSLTLLREVLLATAQPHVGYTPAIWFIEPDITLLARSVLAAGISRCEEYWHAHEFSQLHRVRWFTGSDALRKLEDSLTASIDLRLPDRVLTVPGTPEDQMSAVVEVFNRVNHVQRTVNQALADQTHELYPARSPGSFGAQWRGSERKRALIITSRFSTFVRHASEDLCAALLARNVDARVLIEPDDHSTLSAVAYRRAIVEHKPDVIISVNYPRTTLGAAIPRHVPYVCWIHDALPHLFDEGVGKHQTPLDLLTGHLFAELFTTFKYPSTNAWATPVVASPKKFHTDDVSIQHRTGYRCDVAVVSHHSQTPDALHTTLCEQARTVDPRLVRAMQALRPRIDAVADDCAATPMGGALKIAVQEELSRAGAAHASDRALITTLRSYALPMLDRTLRHRTIQDAVAVCEKHNLRLHLYGAGWESHPLLGRFAKGAVPHGEALRAVYRCAGAHLHISAHNLLHQRVLECFLSGGLCLARFQRDALAGCKARVQYECLQRAPDVCTSEHVGYYLSTTDLGTRLEMLGRTAGCSFPEHEGKPILWLAQQRAVNMRELAGPLAQRPEFLDLSPHPHELIFVDRASLEERLMRALHDRTWRENIIATTRAIVQYNFTHDRLAADIIRHVGDLGATSFQTSLYGRMAA
jgi:hypothetical protein